MSNSKDKVASGISKSLVQGIKNSVAAKLAAVDGLKYSTRRKFSFRTVPGEKQFKGYWAWKPDAGGKYICGSFNQYKSPSEIIVCAPPGKPDEFSIQMAEHEFAHWWRWVCYGETAHNPKYKKAIFNWRD